MIIQGAEYLFNKGKVRVIQYDNIEVFYEPWDEHSKSWYFDNSKSVYFLRVSTPFFEQHASKIDSPNHRLSLERFSPGLPMRINRFDNLSWLPLSEKFEDKLKKVLKNSFVGIDSKELILTPSGKTGRPAKSIKIDSQRLDGKLLMKFAFYAQAQYVVESPHQFSISRLATNGKETKHFPGIGLYRAGIKNNVPEYYLGGFVDFAENVTFEETHTNS